MAGLNIDLNKDISLGKQSRGKMPTKTSINLVVKKESFLTSAKGRRTVIAGIVIACLLAGILFVRPLIMLSRANAKVSRLQTELDEANSTIKSMGGIEDEYAHYTTEGMTEEELARVDRVKVMKLVEKASVNSGAVKSWELTENMMTLQVTGSSLAELNQIAGALENEPIVERCVINTADRGANSQSDGPVQVSFVVYLVPEDGSQAADDDAAAEQETKAEEGQEQ